MRNSTSTPVMLCRVTWGAAMLPPFTRPAHSTQLLEQLLDPITRPNHSTQSLDNARQLLGLIFLLQRLDQAFQVAVDHVCQLVQREIDTVIGHAALRKVISANALGAIARAHL